MYVVVCIYAISYMHVCRSDIINELGVEYRNSENRSE